MVELKKPKWLVEKLEGGELIQTIRLRSTVTFKMLPLRGEKMSLLLLIGVVPCLVNSVTMESMEAVDGDALKQGYKFHNPVSADQNNPWISGPLNKKFQFHVGQQSWLSAREMCLSHNSDLVTIQSEQELEWVLSHYKPQGGHLRERQIQIGLMVDPSPRSADASMREWRWVDQQPLNSSLIPWTSGEPFDHSLGKERCALLNVNERKIDDVDCDLGGGPVHFYRYICERTHDNHMKHEELNNPLWKKLEDILVFFGISTASKTTNRTEELGPGEDEEDYWEKAGNPVKLLLNATTDASLVSNAEENAEKDASLNTDEKKEAEKTAEILLESTSADSHLISTSNSSAQQQPNTTLNTDLGSLKPPNHKETILETGEVSEGGKANATESALVKPTRIVVAYGTTTLKVKSDEGSVPADASIPHGKSKEIDLDQLASKRQIEQKAPELTIANDVIEVETASLETTRTTKADPLAHLADTLERTFAAVSSDDVNGTESQMVEDKNSSKSSAPTQSKMHSLERIISAVQKMIEIQHVDKAVKQETVATPSNQTIKEQVPEGPLDAAASALLNSSQNIRPISAPSTSILAIIQTTSSTQRKAKENFPENQSNAVESALNVEDDFLQAAADNKAHPNINSGDLIIAPNSKDDELIGSCGDPTHKHSDQETGSSIELEPELQANETVSQEKKVKIDKFLRSLRTFLDTAHPSQLKSLVDDGRTDKRPLVERLEQVVATKKATKDAENPVEELKKLHEEKIKKDKKTEIEAESARIESKSGAPENEVEEPKLAANSSSISDSDLAGPTSSKLDSLNAVQIQQLHTYSAINHLSSPTQEIIDAVLALKNNSPSINGPVIPEATQKNGSNLLVLNPSVSVLTNESVVQETETEDPSSIFPHPNFTLLNTNETLAVPKKVEERVQAERKRIDGTYKKFLNSFTAIEGNNNNQLAAATNDFIRRILTADAQRLIVKQSPSVEFRREPGHVDTDTHGIVIEKDLGDSFDIIGDNSNKLND